MNPKTARRILTTHFEDPNGDIPSDVEKALATLERHPDLMAEYRDQAALDKKAARHLSDIDVPDNVLDHLATAVSSLPASRFRWNDPAMLAVLIGIVLLVLVLTWDVLGRPASFPPDAIEIAAEVYGIPGEKFEEAGLTVGEMDDWFVLKGFDAFTAPGRLAEMPVGSASLVTSGSIPMAVLEIPENNLRIAGFDAAALDIRIPEGEWRFIQLEKSLSAAIRLEGSQCVLVVHPGSVETLRAGLE